MPNTQELTRLASEDSPSGAPPVAGDRTTGYAVVRSQPLTEPTPGEHPTVPMPGENRPPETPATLGDLARLDDRLLTHFDRAVVAEGRRLQDRIASEMAVVVAASEERTKVLITESEERTKVLIAESEERTKVLITESEERTRAFVVQSIRESEERMKEFVAESIRQSEERMKAFVLDAVRQSEERMKDFMLECLRRSEERADKRMDRIDRRTNILIAAIVVPAFAATVAFLHRWFTTLF